MLWFQWVMHLFGVVVSLKTLISRFYISSYRLSCLLVKPQFLVALVNELADGGKSQVARMAAGLQLKNHLTSKEPTVRAQYQTRWLSLEENVRLHVKGMVRTRLTKWVKFEWFLNKQICINETYYKKKRYEESKKRIKQLLNLVVKTVSKKGFTHIYNGTYNSRHNLS